MSIDPNGKLKSIANRVIDKVPNKDPEKFGSVIIILTVISIILTLIRIWQGCHQSKLSGLNADEKYGYFDSQIKETSIRRTWYTRMIVKKAIKKELSKEDYKEYGVALMNAILDTATDLTPSDIKALVEASNV